MPDLTPADAAGPLQLVESLVRQLHHYGDPPDTRLQKRVDRDVEEVLDAVRAYATTLTPAALSTVEAERDRLRDELRKAEEHTIARCAEALAPYWDDHGDPGIAVRSLPRLYSGSSDARGVTP